MTDSFGCSIVSEVFYSSIHVEAGFEVDPVGVAFIGRKEPYGIKGIGEGLVRPKNRSRRKLYRQLAGKMLRNPFQCRNMIC